MAGSVKHSLDIDGSFHARQQEVPTSDVLNVTHSIGQSTLAGGENSLPPVYPVTRDQIPSAVRDEKHIVYCKDDDVQHVGTVDKEVYGDAVRQLSIPCVDTFLFDLDKRVYLMVLRKDPPAKDEWWLPGGRQHKGESFNDCCIRKCKEEVGLDVVPTANLGTFSTVFPDSAWGCQTHTINTVIFATLKPLNDAPNINKHHENWAWKPLDSAPTDPYIHMAYNKALKHINKNL